MNIFNFKNGYKIVIQIFYVNLKSKTIAFLFFNKTKAFHMINKPTNHALSHLCIFVSKYNVDGILSSQQ
jgi:hypothetical protein